MPEGVALILFPIWGAGGLTTDVIHYRRILRKAGIKCDFFRIMYSDAKHGEKQPLTVNVGEDGPRVFQNTLSITDKNLSSTLNILGEYDTIFFVHPCPHLTDRAKAVANWTYLYTEFEAQKICKFTDVYSSELYPWMMELDADVHAIERWAVNSAVQKSLLGAWDIEVPLCTNPFAYSKHGIKYVKENDVLWANAWRSWKGIKKFADATSMIKGSIVMHGSGRELRQMRKAEHPVLQYSHGLATPGEIIRCYKRSRLSVDLTGATKTYHGHYNRTMFEPMFFGCVTVCMPTVVEPYSPIPSDIVWATDREHIAERINELLANEKKRKRIAKHAYEWVQENLKPEQVVKEVMEGI